MAIREVAADCRRVLGPVGAIVGFGTEPPPVDVQLAGVRRLERAGYPAVWTNEGVGADALVRAALWLAATEHLVIGTSIANMWVRPWQTAHAAASQLSQAYPGRFVLGLGVGRPEQAAEVSRDFGSPRAAARAYLEPVGDPGYPRILGAIGPKMLALAAELTDGALPAGIPPDGTAAARATLGADKLLVVYIPIQPVDDPTAIVDTIGRHREAGADHVIIGMSYDADFDVAIDLLERLAPTITTGVAREVS